jgi:hypothetical protein
MLKIAGRPISDVKKLPAGDSEAHSPFKRMNCFAREKSYFIRTQKMTALEFS